MTNREWLNSLSDEEFADRATEGDCCEWCSEYMKDCDGECSKNVLNWLKANKEEIINEN